MAVQTSHNQYILQAELLKLSESPVWSTAIKEWKLDSINQTGARETCLCSHYPITEVCYISNDRTGKTALVGNVCVKLFSEETELKGTHKIFSSLKKIKQNKKSSANKSLIDYAYEQKILSKEDYGMYLAIWRKKNYSKNQTAFKKEMNKRIIREIKKPEERTSRESRLAAEVNALKLDVKHWTKMDLVNNALRKGFILLKDYDFYKSIWKLNKDLTSSQERLRSFINRKMIEKY